MQLITDCPNFHGLGKHEPDLFKLLGLRDDRIRASARAHALAEDGRPAREVPVRAKPQAGMDLPYALISLRCKIVDRR